MGTWVWRGGWLTRFTKEDADDGEEEGTALMLACAGGHLDVVRWLVTTFEFGEDGAHICRDGLTSSDYNEHIAGFFAAAGIVLGDD